MQYISGIAAALGSAFVMGRWFGWGLLPMLVALGLGLMAYGLVDMRIKKGSGGDNAG